MKRTRWTSAAAIAGLCTLLAGGVVAGVHDLGVALAAAVREPSHPNPIMDPSGGVWTFGVFTTTYGVFTPFPMTWIDGDFQGFYTGEKDKVPYMMTNLGDEPLTHGDDTGNLGYRLRPGEALLHPGWNSLWTGFRLEVPQAGFYSLSLVAADVAKNGNGQNVLVLTNGVLVGQCDVTATGDVVASNRLELADLALGAGDVVSLMVDPKDGDISFDSTVVDFRLTERRTLVADMAELLRQAARAGTLPYVTADGLTFCCGTYAAGSSQPTPFDHVAGSAAPRGVGFRHAASNGLPYVLANHTGVATPFVTPTTAADGVPAWWMGAAPPTAGGSVYTSVTVPSNGVYEAELELRDTVSATMPKNMETQAFQQDGHGMVGQVRVNHADIRGGAFVWRCPGMTNATLKVKRMALQTGDVVSFCVDSHGNGELDRAAWTARLYASEEAAVTPAEILNVDIDGYQASDGAPTANDTFDGRGRVGAPGQFWNGIAAEDMTVNTLTRSGLKTADGAATSVALTLATTDGTELGFDRFSDGALNSLLADYLYAYDHTVEATFTGLVPGATYDLYVFTALKVRGDSLVGTYTVGDVAKRPSTYQVFDVASDAVAFEGVRADEQGHLKLSVGRGSNGDVAKFINGLQLVGPFTAE